MVKSSANCSDERRRKKPNSHPLLVVMAITAVLLFSSTISGLIPSSSTILDLSAYIVFSQAQQNQTGNMTTNNTNVTTAGACAYIEMLHPRQI